MSQHNLRAIALNMVGVPADCYAAYPTMAVSAPVRDKE
jgi:hypothetical protein